MSSNNLLTKYLEAIDNKNPLIINYGKGIIFDEDIKDYATWDDEMQAYRDETGIWDIELLLDIAKGKVENIKIELGE